MLTARAALAVRFLHLAGPDGLLPHLDRVVIELGSYHSAVTRVSRALERAGILAPRERYSHERSKLARSLDDVRVREVMIALGDIPAACPLGPQHCLNGAPCSARRAQDETLAMPVSEYGMRPEEVRV